MNSPTWFVTAGKERRAAKSALPASRRSYLNGLAVTDRLNAAGAPGLWQCIEPLLPQPERNPRHPGRKRIPGRQAPCWIRRAADQH